MLYPTNALILDQIKDSIDNNVNELISKVIKYNQTALYVILFMESRKVILQGFKVFVDQILELHKEQREAKDLLTENIYRFYLKGKIENNQLLSHSDFEQIKSSIDSIENIKNMLLCKFDDLEIALQNEFIGKLFPEKISERNPIDDRFKVLKIDKKINGEKAIRCLATVMQCRKRGSHSSQVTKVTSSFHALYRACESAGKSHKYCLCTTCSN